MLLGSLKLLHVPVFDWFWSVSGRRPQSTQCQCHRSPRWKIQSTDAE